MKDGDELLDLKAAAQLLGLKPATIYKGTSQGTIPHYRPLGKLYFLKLELIDWVLNSRVATREELEAKAASLSLRAKR